MSSFVKDSDWLTFLCTGKENEILKTIKGDADLIWRKLEFRCLLTCTSFTGHHKEPCSCCIEFESLKSKKPLDIFLEEINSNLDKRRCRHLRSKDELNEDELEGTTCIYCVHIAAAFGYKRVLNAILPKTQCKDMHEYRSQYQDRYSTNIVNLTPLNIASIHHRLNVFELVVRKCKFFVQSMVPYLGARPDLGIHSGHCLINAAEYDDVSFIKLILQHCKDKISKLIVIDAFFVAVLDHKHRSAKYLVNKFDLYPSRYQQLLRVAKISVFESGDEKLFKILLGCKQLVYGRCLESLIALGKTRFVEILLKRAKKQKHPLSTVCPFTIQAVLCNSLEIVKLLIMYLDSDIHKTYDGYNGVDWARALGYTDIEEQLENSGVQTDFSILTTFPPLMSILRFFRFKYDVYKTVKRLISLGADVNAISSGGNTPFSKVVTEVDGDIKYPIIRLLLTNGADPFKGKIQWYSFRDQYDQYLVTEFLYCNVNICGDDFRKSVFRSILCCYREENKHVMPLAFNYAHTIPRHYCQGYKELFRPYEHGSEDIFAQFDELFYTPKSLLVLCRNSLRRALGQKIHEFVNTNLLPLQIRKIITLESELKEEGVLTDLNGTQALCEAGQLFTFFYEYTPEAYQSILH